LNEALERKRLLDWQPQLASANIDIKSPTDRGYNCIAWAVGDDSKIWSPAVAVGGKQLGGYYWPDDVEVLPTVGATEKVFQAHGFVRTQISDFALETGVEKIAIFGYDVMNLVTHAARQVPSGRWASKMGENADVEHDLHDIEGDMFGEVRSIMRKDSAASSVPESSSDEITAELVVVTRRTRS
jgi:hypothetical protein